jgi:arylsulfatase A-like enzyme
MKHKSKFFLLSFMASTCGVLSAQTTSKPNILWITSEDNNVNWLGCYGNKEAKTPTLDKLAKEGFLYTNAFASAPVCAASRSTWITGINAVSMGTHNMRSRYKIPHNIIPYYPDVLRKNGYFCANYPKTDYNIAGRPDTECWDMPKGPVNWQLLKKKQPFFQVINCGNSHESQVKRGYKNGSYKNLKHSASDVTLYKYHPDLSIMKQTYARYYDCIENMDSFEAKILKGLQDSGLAENTIVIYCSDHGGVLPRSKRFLFDSGLHSPLIIRIPEKFKYLWPASKPGTKVDRLVSFLDMPKTWLSITGCTPPDVMQGLVFLGKNKDAEPKQVFAFRGRMDERIDNQRAVRNKRFLYVKNYMPFVPWGQHLEYMWEIKAYQAWDDYSKTHQNDKLRSRFFSLKLKDELYDSQKDRDNVNNIIDNPEYKKVLAQMKKSLREWQLKNYDAGLIPECEMINRERKYKSTMYEIARNKAQYDVERYLEVSDVALEQNSANKKILMKYLQDKDSAVRYWGLVGLIMIPDSVTKADLAKITVSLKGEKSHVNKAFLAWLMVKKKYQKDVAYDMLRQLLVKRSYATLYILNLLDWMGDDAEPLMDAVVKARNNQLNIRKMKRFLLNKFSREIPDNVQEKKKK